MTYRLKGIENLNEEDKINELISYIKIQLDDEDDKLALMSNISAFIMAIIDKLNWVGFYLVKDDQLVLGPFQGLPACTRLSKEKGVCAKAWKDACIVKVDDVHEFKDHIACDSNSLSELVIPLFKDDKVYALLDIDSPQKARFNKLHVDGFSYIGKLIEDVLYHKW